MFSPTSLYYYNRMKSILDNDSLRIHSAKKLLQRLIVYLLISRGKDTENDLLERG